MSTKAKFTTLDASARLMQSMEVAINKMIKELNENGKIEEDKDYSGGFAERFSK